MAPRFTGHPITALGLWSLLACSSCGAPAPSIENASAASRPAPSHAANSILIDSVHAHNALDLPGDADPYAYHHVYTYRRAFAFLNDRGARSEEIKTGKLTPELLARHGLLFINLVSADLPPFTVPEISAIRGYVTGGGSLLIITDHSNCYYHNHKLAPLLGELGIESYNETACERGENTLGAGAGWITVTRFKEHPVTRGLRHVGFQTGGTVDGRFAVATTSPNAWGDLWQAHPYGEGDSPGFYGNWAQDAGERVGELGVILARTFGKGRIVIVADQNIFADPFLDFADNYRLWLNAVAWLLDEPSLADAAAYQRWRTPRLLLYDDFSHTAWAGTVAAGYYNAYVQIGRAMPAFVSDDLSEEAGAIVFAHDRYELADGQLDALIKHLRSGRAIVILAPAGAARGVAGQVTKRMGEVEAAPIEGAVVHRWPGGGRLILYTEPKGVRNEKMPIPEKEPDASERVGIATLMAILRDAAKPGTRP
jgi:hypothetical protein